MTIAVLIIAHKNKDELEFLIASLKHPCFKIYLHVDKLSKFTYNDIKGDFIPLLKNYSCAWGSYNVVRVTFELLKLSYKDNNDYYLLISGQDFPIMSLNSIIDFFKKNEGKNYIHLLPFQSHIPSERIENANSRLEFFHIPRRVPLSLFERIKFSILYRIAKFQRRYDFLKLPIPKALYFGENWFNLHKNLVGKLLKVYSSNSFLRLRLSIGSNMEEVLPHTLIERFLKDEYEVISDSLRYTKWKHPSNHPEILKFNDVKDVLHSNFLFARKFDDLLDLKKIENQINGK